MEATDLHAAPIYSMSGEMREEIVKVQEVLGKKSATVITVTPDQSLLEASQLLAQHKIGVVVVVDSEGAPVGILSERDIVRELAEVQSEVVNRSIRDAMTEDIVIGFPEDDLAYVSSTMTDRRIRHLPIMEDEKLVGIISIGDVVKAQLDNVQYEAHMLRQYITNG